MRFVFRIGSCGHYTVRECFVIAPHLPKKLVINNLYNVSKMKPCQRNVKFYAILALVYVISIL